MPVRRMVAERVRGLFAHIDRAPLVETHLYPGDPGLFGPESVTWLVNRHPAVFAAGIRSLLVQACHPEVLAGVVDHSRYERDPLGRLSRTSYYVTVSTFGSLPEVEEAVEMVRRAHRPVRGLSPRGIPYTADDPELSAWVHNALVDSFLTCYRVLGPGLSEEQADAYVREQQRLGLMLGADPLPDTAGELAAWLADHPDVDRSPDLPSVVRFLVSPPLTPGIRAGYRVLLEGAVATIPPRLQTVLGLRPKPGGVAGARTLIGALGWALGPSPAYQAASDRVLRRADRSA
ncbi:MAG: hypothetical protein KatS3mg011_1971 [Acidimicrobiia bacterium]|nr:MAG: hypothetical protein KatS3mg011_1971 [Acidimicrobiia bacterium]